MVPRVDIIASEASALLPVVSALMSEGGHSRIPIYDETIDTVVGIVHARDLLKYLSAGDTAAKLTVREIARSPVFIPDSKPLDELLQEFQEQHVTIAVVVDEYGEIAGLVTLEDVIEQIVGEIEDEHDQEEDNIIDYGDGRYLLQANTPLIEFNEFFETSIKNEDYDTVAGLVISGFTYLPEQMSEITLHGFQFKVLKTDSRRIHLLEVQRVTQAIETPLESSSP